MYSARRFTAGFFIFFSDTDLSSVILAKVDYTDCEDFIVWCPQIFSQKNIREDKEKDIYEYK